MSTYLLAASVSAASLSLLVFALSVLALLKVLKVNKALQEVVETFKTVRLVLQESQQGNEKKFNQILDNTADLQKKVLNSVSSAFSSTTNTIKIHLDENLEPIKEANSSIASHVKEYESLLGSQERLIDAVNTLANGGSKRHA